MRVARPGERKTLVFVRQTGELPFRLGVVFPIRVSRNAVGNRVFAGKGARDEAATALTFAVLTWRDDQSLQARGVFRGFEILSRGKTRGFGLLQDEERIPDVFVRGRTTYSAKLNPVRTIQSIERTLRNLDKLADDQQSRVARIEKDSRVWKTTAREADETSLADLIPRP